MTSPGSKWWTTIRNTEVCKCPPLSTWVNLELFLYHFKLVSSRGSWLSGVTSSVISNSNCHYETSSKGPFSMRLSRIRAPLINCKDSQTGKMYNSYTKYAKNSKSEWLCIYSSSDHQPTGLSDHTFCLQGTKKQSPCNLSELENWVSRDSTEIGWASQVLPGPDTALIGREYLPVWESVKKVSKMSTPIIPNVFSQAELRVD